MNKFKDKNLRSPIVEGIFYPSDKSDLEQQVNKYIKGLIPGCANIILTPHAGYNVAGQLMAEAFMAAASRQIKEVVIISPVHREECDQIILPYFKSFYTAAGNLNINMKSLHLFKGEDPAIVREDIPHLEEHAIEDQLPFISRLFPESTILPVLLGKTTISLVKKLSSALKRTYEDRMEEVLFVVTSNLSLYEKEDAAMAKSDKALQLFKKGDWREICEEKRTGQIDACGAGALAAFLALYTCEMTMDVINCSRSEGKESEKGKMVSYGALSFKEKN